MTTQTSAPAVVNDPLFRSMVREHLVTLGNDYPGLGLKVTGKENAVVIFPRAGRPLRTLDEFRRLKWMHVSLVESDGQFPSFSFKVMSEAEVEEFLRSITSAVPA